MVRLAAAAERKCPAQLSKSNGNGGSRLANVSAFPRALLLSFIRDGTKHALDRLRCYSAEKACAFTGSALREELAGNERRQLLTSESVIYRPPSAVLQFCVSTLSSQPFAGSLS